MPASSTLHGDYCVFLRDVTLHLPIGILDEERGQTQPVIVNVQMFIRDPGRFEAADPVTR